MFACAWRNKDVMNALSLLRYSIWVTKKSRCWLLIWVMMWKRTENTIDCIRALLSCPRYEHEGLSTAVFSSSHWKCITGGKIGTRTLSLFLESSDGDGAKCHRNWITRKLCCHRETARCRCKFQSICCVEAVVSFVLIVAVDTAALTCWSILYRLNASKATKHWILLRGHSRSYTSAAIKSSYTTSCRLLVVTFALSIFSHFRGIVAFLHQ